MSVGHCIQPKALPSKIHRVTLRMSWWDRKFEHSSLELPPMVPVMAPGSMLMFMTRTLRAECLKPLFVTFCREKLDTLKSSSWMFFSPFSAISQLLLLWKHPRFLKDHPEYSAAGYGVFGFELVNHLAPGDAVVKTWALWSLFRLCTVLFGQLSTARYAREEAGSARQRLVRDFPKDGDCSYTHTQER